LPVILFLSGFLKNSDERAKRKKDCVKQLIEAAINIGLEGGT